MTDFFDHETVKRWIDLCSRVSHIDVQRCRFDWRWSRQGRISNPRHLENLRSRKRSLIKPDIIDGIIVPIDHAAAELAPANGTMPAGGGGSYVQNLVG